MVMLDFICVGSAELFGTGWEQKNQNEKFIYVSNLIATGFEHTPCTPREVNQRFRLLGHTG